MTVREADALGLRTRSLGVWRGPARHVSAATATVGNTAAATLTCTPGFSVDVDDMVLVIVARNALDTFNTPTATGLTFTALTSVSSTDIAIFAAPVTTGGTCPAVTATTSTSSGLCMAVMAVRGVDLADIADELTNTTPTASASQVGLDVTPTYPGGYCFQIWHGVQGSMTTVDAISSGWTELANFTSTAGNDQRVNIVGKALGSAVAATGSNTWTLSASSAGYLWTLVIKGKQ